MSTWCLPDKQPFRVVDDVWIPMPDGVRLSARLWIPEGAARAPVVLEYIPYRKRDLYRAHDEKWGAVLAGHGIAYARVDVRGTGDSEGVMTDEYSEVELADGVSIIAWLAEQAWSSGAVGMRGISWGGINTLQVASRAPASLKAIMPMAACDNRFRGDAHYIGGVLARPNFQWGTLFKLVMASPPGDEPSESWERAWRARLEATPSILALWTSHQREDAYWRRGSIDLDYGAIRCPVYVVGGWADPYVDTVGRLLENLAVPRRGLIGPWGHTYPYLAPPCGLDWTYEEVRWWHHWLAGADTGLADEPMLRVFMPYATAAEHQPATPPGRWVYEQTWPGSNVSSWHLPLMHDGRYDAPIAETAAVSGTTIVGDTMAEWIDKLPREQSPDDARSHVFVAVPLLADDLEILGTPVLRLRLKADKPIARIAARLTDVSPDGTSWRVAYGLRNLTHRDGHDAPEPLEPGRFYDVALPLSFIAHRFRKGHRIRLALSDNLWPLAWPSPEFATLTLSLDRCSLELPLRATSPVPNGAMTDIGAQGPTNSAMTAPEASRMVRDDTPTSFVVDGVRITRARCEEARMAEGDPNSARWTQEVRTAWQGNGLACEVVARSELTSTPTMFQICERLEALIEAKVIFTRETTHDIPRDLM